MLHLREEDYSRSKAAAAAWDPSYETEDVNWYSEYMARHGPISMRWLRGPGEGTRKGKKGRSFCEVKGMGLLRDWTSMRQDKVIAPLEDGRVCVWDLSQYEPGTDTNFAGMSAAGLLTMDISSARRRGMSKSTLDFVNVGECVSVDSLRQRAYLAVGNILNEVDIATLQLISQQRYPWSIFALSQETDYSAPLTVATTLSMQMYDSRLSAAEEEEVISMRCEQCLGFTTKSRLFSPTRIRPGGGRIRSDVPSREDAGYSSLFQPAPLSVLHPPAPCVNNILLAGRFPSILCYDRRFLPRLQNAVHSGGRLSGLASLAAPRFPWASSSESSWPDSHTIVACGEYNGKGSLELYRLSPTSYLPSPSHTTSDDNAPETLFSPSPLLHNRQSAASSKLLSVQPHGTRIVYSDADGNVKWVERDGRTEVRCFNINSSDHTTEPTSSTGRNEVAHRVLPIGSQDQTDGDILIWTGERIGRLRLPSAARTMGAAEGEDADALSTDDEDVDWEMRSRRREERRREREYERAMRQALERQADEVRWMGRLGMA